MQAKQFLLVAAAALAATSGYAVEATQFVPPPSSLARAEVTAEVARAKADGTLAAHHETYGQVAATPSTRDRADVRAEARSAARNHSFNTLYVGS